MLKKLKSLFDEHRKKAFVTCDETCFCWDVENFLTSQKEAVEQPRAADAELLSCEQAVNNFVVDEISKVFPRR